MGRIICGDAQERKIKCELYHDNFQNYKQYGIPKAQLVIADIPYGESCRYEYAENYFSLISNSATF